AVEQKVGSLGHRVYAIVNYDNFSILPELLDEYSDAVRGLVDRFYSGVSRYTTSGFLRMKLGEALEKRGLRRFRKRFDLSRHRCNAIVQSTPVLDQLGDEIDHSWRQRGCI